MPAPKRAPRQATVKQSIRTGDEVQVTAGKDRGKRGTVTEVIPSTNRVIVEGVNLVKRHLRRQPNALQAGIVDMPAPLSRANVMLICPNCGEASKTGRTLLSSGKHARICKNCSEIVDKER
jgi:large subunit ribosomal protein L24